MMGLERRRLTDAALGGGLDWSEGERPTDTPAICADKVLGAGLGLCERACWPMGGGGAYEDCDGAVRWKYEPAVGDADVAVVAEKVLAHVPGWVSASSSVCCLAGTGTGTATALSRRRVSSSLSVICLRTLLMALTQSSRSSAESASTKKVRSAVTMANENGCFAFSCVTGTTECTVLRSIARDSEYSCVGQLMRGNAHAHPVVLVVRDTCRAEDEPLLLPGLFLCQPPGFGLAWTTSP